MAFRNVCVYLYPLKYLVQRASISEPSDHQASSWSLSKENDSPGAIEEPPPVHCFKTASSKIKKGSNNESTTPKALRKCSAGVHGSLMATSWKADVVRQF